MAASKVLGGVAYSCILGYFLALVYAFSGMNEDWKFFFVNNVLWFLYIPFTLGLVYFFVRVQLGRWLLEQGAVDEAVGWVEPLQHYNFWLRGKREVLIHRLVYAQVWLRRCDYTKAQEVLWQDEPLAERAPEMLELYVWRGVWALRVENLKVLKEEIAKGKELKKPVLWRSALLAVEAESALRAGEVEQAKRLLEEASWKDSHWVVGWIKILAASSGEYAILSLDKALLKCLEIKEIIAMCLPGALPEFLCAYARLLRDAGEVERADEQLKEACELVHQGLGDARSEWVVRQYESKK